MPNDVFKRRVQLFQDGEQHRPLPEGKDYHLFFSHSSKDRDWVIEALYALEAPPYNLKCCYDERDFTAGQGIISNIENAIDKSACTCLVLTPDFVQSDFCAYEQELANLLHVEGKGKVIPIMLKKCQVPKDIRFINYIEPGQDLHLAYKKVNDAVKTGWYTCTK